MHLQTGPSFAIYVVWHPKYLGGQEIANYLHTHFSRDLYKIMSEGSEVNVFERSTFPNAQIPFPIDWNETEFTAVVVLAESMMVDDRDWIEYIRGITQEAKLEGNSVGIFPVTIESRGFEIGFEQQALRWNNWELANESKARRLTSDLTHGFCRMLRSRLDKLKNSDDGNEPLAHHLRKIQVFISHSKHDNDGELLAHSIRSWIHENSLLESFFDVYDIPPGQSFEQVLLDQIGAGAAIAIHTDSYSSREWCRREVIEAKLGSVPMIVVDCVRDSDPRGIPYFGNVPIVRMEPNEKDRIGAVIGGILDEIFRTWLWLCRVGQHLVDSTNVLFTARPPELISLAASVLESDELDKVIVYPEPLISRDEEKLFLKVAPHVRVLTLSEWLEEQ